MPTPNKKPENNLEPEPGTIVWVRRRNGSWWPGRIICKKELIASNVMSPRSGTPVKLLGREDASVDWYNIEKSKRVKAFRCGEFDECIRKAEAMAGMHSKRREKYARREDAIVDALELEKEYGEHMKGGANGVAVPPPLLKKPKLKGKQKNLENEPLKDEAEDSGLYRKYPRKHQHKPKAVKDQEAPDFDDGPPSLPRMRGLQDLVSGGASSGQVAALDGGSSEASLLDNSGEPAQGKSAKRKRSKSGEDGPVKRRDKKRPILQVIETLERDTDEQTAAEEKANQVVVKREVPCEGEDKLSEECESTQETLNMALQGSSRNVAHVLDAQSSSKHLMTSSLEQPVVAVEGTLHQSTSTSAPALQLHRSQVKTGTPGGSKPKKSKAKLASSGLDLGKAAKGKTEDNSTISRLDGSINSVSRNIRGKQQQPLPPAKTEAEETVTGCCPSTKSDGQKLGHTGPLHPKTRFEKQPVPMISLASVKNKKPVDGYPVAVEVLPESLTRKKSRSQAGAPPASWQTAKRTARQRTPRSEIPPTLELQQQQQQQSHHQQHNKKQGKEALSKKLLKKAVLTSKKIRTLASISEKQQPEVSVMLKAAPEWPVPTVVPVSVAMNRLRAVVCS